MIDVRESTAEKQHQTQTPPSEPAAAPVFDPLCAAETWSQFLTGLRNVPGEAVAAQQKFMQQYSVLCERTLKRMTGEEQPPVAVPAANDRRFRDTGWDEPYFDFIKQSYLLFGETLSDLTRSAGQGLTERENIRMTLLMRQWLAALSPSNFPPANPEVLRETLNARGMNFMRGLEHLQQDAETGSVAKADTQSFVAGQNMAITPGKVVFKNALIELIQYEPTTAQVYKRPLLILPPWINRYYVLDMRPENSFVRHAVAAGFTVFLISWVNPDSRHAEYGFDAYAELGLSAALDAIKQATGEPDAHLLGYCLGGTLAAMAAAAEKGRKKRRIADLTLLTAQTDFSQAGDLVAFAGESQLRGIKAVMDSHGGYLQGSEMSSVFDMLRPEELIWTPVVRRYFMGEKAPGFDLLAWNADSVRMPARMHYEYLETFYLHDRFASAGVVLCGKTVRVDDIDLPVYAVACREDHIAPHASVYKGTRRFAGPVRFVSARSGHIAGVINPPAAGKYGYVVHEAASGALLPEILPEVLPDAGASVSGSWWPDWYAWLADRSGSKVPARVPAPDAPAAPGTYVFG